MKRLALAMLLVPTLAAAAPINLGGSSGEFMWNMSSSTFWNNTSYDRNGRANIGHWLSGTGGSDVPNFYADSPYAFPNQYGDGSSLWGFEGPLLVSHLQSVTGWNDTFGIYDLRSGASTQTLGAAWDSKFSSWLLTGTFGFWLRSGEGNVWYSGEASPDGRSHFALFGNGQGTWWIGIEDATFKTPRTADWDYNDVILQLEAQPVPEPISLSTFGLGLLAIGALKRRWR